MIPNSTTLKKLSYLIFYVVLVFIYVHIFYKEYQLIVSDDFPYLSVAYFLKFPYDQNYIGPFYPLYLKLFLLIFSNPLDAYRFSILFANISVFSIIYWTVLQSIKGNFLVFFTMVLLVTSPFIFNIFPKISFFCCLIIFCGILFIQNKTVYQKLFILLLISFLLAYTRPEFYLSFCVIGLLGCFKLRNDKAKILKFFPFFLILFLFGIFFLGGIPFGSRSVDAFKQHFMLNYVKWNPQLKIPNYLNAEFDLFDKVYGRASSLFELISVNPYFLIKHVLQNVVNLLESFKNFFFTSFSYVNEYMPLNKYVWITTFFILAISISWRRFLENLKLNYKYFFHQCILPFALLVFPTIFAIFLIYPRDHYIIFYVYFLFLLGGGILNSIEFKSNLVNWILSFLLFFILIFKQINLNSGPIKKDYLNDAFLKMQLYGNQKKNTFFSINLFDNVFFRKYFKNENNLNRSVAFLDKDKPDVIYFRDLGDIDSQNFKKLTILREYKADSNFVNNKIIIFVKR